MGTLLQNLRFGLRMLLKQPMISGISILALSLGIGLTTTMYSIVHGAGRDLPFEDGHRIFRMSATNPSQGIQNMDVSPHDYLDWKAQQTTFDELAAFYQGTINLATDAQPLRFEGAFMTASAFSQIRVQPALGRGFSAADEQPGASPVLLIGHDVWRNQFNSDPSVVGRDARINGLPGTIIGVMPEGFRFPMDEEAWLPLQIDLGAIERGQGMFLDVFGRLRAGVALESAVAEFNGIAERLEAEYPETNEGLRVTGAPYIKEYLDDQVMAMLWTMQGAVFLVLLIACANVANLLLSRALDRTKEVAIRTALGAGRWQVISQFLTEVLVLALIGGVLGLGIARIGTALFNAALVDIQKPYWIVISLDFSVLMFTTALVVVASLVAGVIPALQVSGSSLSDVLKDESRGSSSFKMGRLSKVLVVAEVAFSCGLLVGAGLMIKSVVQLSNVDYGFPTEVFTSRLGLFVSDYPEEADRTRFYLDLQEALSAQPGVTSVALADALPATQRASMTRFRIEGESYPTREDHPLTNFAAISPRFFEAFDTQLLQGRDFNLLDTADSLAVTIINTSLAASAFPGENPIGRRIRFGVDDDSPNPWLTIVGVAPDMYMNGVVNVGQRIADGLYLPMTQADRRFMSIAVRGAGEPLEMAGMVRRQVTALDPNLPIYWVQTLQAEINADTWFFRVFGNLFMVFGFAALFLATIGLYGVMTFAVRRRTQEMGIRIALGAKIGDVLGLVVRQGLWQIGAGLVLGLVLAALMASGLELVLFDVDPRDPAIFAGITLVLAVTGLLACLVPAGRAARIDPIIALRN